MVALCLIVGAIPLSLVASAGATSTAHAARLSAPADRAVAADARKLKRCLSVNRGHPRRCAAARHALQLQRASRALASAQRRHAPTTFGSGRTGTAAGAAGSARNRSRGTRDRRDPVPITAGPPSEAPPAPAEEAKQAPGETSTSQPATFQPGINSGSAAVWELPGATLLGAKLVRVEVPIAETAQEFAPVVAAYAEQGIRVAPLASFYGTLPTPAQARNLASFASAYGPGGTFWSSHTGGQYAIRTIEFGNETSDSYQYADNSPAGYASRARTYALRFAEAAAAIRAVNPGVGLLALADSGNAGPIWVQSMFAAVPGLGSMVAGWTVHPYGPKWRAKLEELVSQTAAQGAPSTIPVDVTEWGLTTDNGRCLSENYGWNPCMAYGEAGEVLSRTVGEMRQSLHGRLGQLLLYQIRDQRPSGESTDREYYFGAVQRELQPKGAYTTAVKAFLASS